MRRRREFMALAVNRPLGFSSAHAGGSAAWDCVVCQETGAIACRKVKWPVSTNTLKVGLRLAPDFPSSISASVVRSQDRQADEGAGSREGSGIGYDAFARRF